MIGDLYEAVITLVLGGMIIAAILLILRFLIDIGPIWALIAIVLGGVLVRKLASARQS